jgi:hypothetical protein
MSFGQWLSANLSPLVNSAGLLFDIAGAWLVAWEVLRVYNGLRHNISLGVTMADWVVGQQLVERPEYSEYEKQKHARMKLGLGLLTIGFTLQLVSNWVK